MTTAIFEIKNFCNISFSKTLDKIIRENIPSGASTRQKAMKHILNEKIMFDICKRTNQEIDYVLRSLGTLGGGNHFIEAGLMEDGKICLTIHSGSRNFGLKIAVFHQKIAEKHIDRLSYGKDLAWLESEEMDSYIKDMKFAQEYAEENRKMMLKTILEKLNIKDYKVINCTHNYIGKDMIIRKGAISAKEGELVIIPWNMRDGLIIGKGKGNSDWNNSAPHGAGRVLSRSKAKKEIKLEDFISSMEGIFSTSISEATIDESPMAYKPAEEVEKFLSETVEIVSRIKPFYNFKAS